MSRYRPRATVGLAVASLALLICAGCLFGGPKTIYPPSINAAAAGKAAIEEYDANKDGKISGDELAKCPSLKSLAGKQGEVTAEKITATIKRWQDSKVGRVTYRCVVLHGGKPLVGATVKLVPEKFLGDKVPSASGTSEVGGAVAPSVPVKAGDPPGMPLGFYHIEVTKDGESIPAKYNTETILGTDVSGSTVGAGTKYNLVY
jgi:hypothetical protein